MAGAAGTDTHNAAGNSDFSRKAMEQAEELIRWAGPKVMQGGPNSNRAARGAGGPDLQEQALTWPAPAARDHKGANSAEHLLVSSGSLHLDQLPNFVEHVFLPQSSPGLPTLAGGSTSSTDIPNSNQPSVRRKLNPIFVEALMRWPTGLSGFERPETAWTRWWLLMPSFLSGLCSTPAASGSEQLSIFGEAA
jgi:hypothetical protein